MLKVDLPQPLAANFAAYIEAHRSDIFSRWSQGVNDDDRIQSTDALSTEALLDHLPKILGEFCDFLRHNQRQETLKDIEENSEIHANQRWHQGFSLKEIVLDIQRFRKLLLADVLREFADTQHCIESEHLQRLESAIDDYYRALIIGSSDEYAEASEPQLDVYRDDGDAAKKPH